MKKVAIYMRVSTAHQEDEETIKSQYMELEARILADGYVLSPDLIYKDDGWSGAIIKRPGLDDLRADMQSKKFDILYFYDRGRISRKYVHQEIILGEAKDNGIECISLHDINGTSTEEVPMGSVMGIFHEYERVKIAERMRIGKVRKVRENKKLLGYNPKFGYDYHHRVKTGPDAKEGYFSINEKQAEIVRQIFNWIAEGKSKHEVKRLLVDADMKPPKGLREQWSSSTLDRLVRDTTYMGKHYYNKSESVETKKPQNPDKEYRKVVKGSRVQRPKEEWLAIDVPIIVEPSLFDKVQVQLGINKRLNSRNNSKNKYLLTGLIKCPCGCSRAGDPANGSAYYRCTDRLNKYPLPRTCYEKGINVTVLDSLVWENIKELLANPTLVVRQAQGWQKSASPLERRSDELKNRLKAFDDEEVRYVKAYGKGTMPEKIYKEVVQELNEKREALVYELNAIEAELMNKTPVPMEQLVDGVVKLVGKLSFNDKRKVIEKLATSIVATKEEITIWGLLPIPTSEQVVLNVNHRHRRPPKRRQINPVQRTDQ